MSRKAEMSRRARPHPLAVLALALLCVVVVARWPRPGGAADNPVLVATVGMTYQAVQKESTLNIGEGVYDNGDQYATRERSFRDTAVFDWHLPNSRLVFPRCRYYSMQTAWHDDPHLIHLWVTTTPDSLTWEHLKQQMYDIRRRLHEDGWKPAHYKQGKNADELLTKMLEHPPVKEWGEGWDKEVGSVTYGKGDVVLSLSAKRLSEVPQGRSPIEGKEFIHYVELDRRAEWEKTYDYDGGIKLPR